MELRRLDFNVLRPKTPQSRLVDSPQSLVAAKCIRNLNSEIRCLTESNAQLQTQLAEAQQQARQHQSRAEELQAYATSLEHTFTAKFAAFEKEVQRMQPLALQATHLQHKVEQQKRETALMNEELALLRRTVATLEAKKGFQLKS